MAAVDRLNPENAAEEAEKERKRAIIAAAMERARQRAKAAEKPDDDKE
jgi:electron transport complex protein RnfB